MKGPNNNLGNRFGIMRARLFLSLLALSFSAVVIGQSADKLFGLANDFYKSKNYAQAIEAYQKLLGQGYRNAVVYYNLGNCYYKTDNVSQAILNYERALRLSPSDEDIRFNLKMANQKTVDRIIPVPQLSVVAKWHSFISSQTSAAWAAISIICIWIAFIAFAFYLFADRIRRWAFFSGVVLVFFCLFFVSLSYIQSQAENGAGQAILTVANTYVKSAPDAGSTDLFLVHEGIRITLLDKVGDWSKIQLADGKVGWVEQSSYTVI